TYNGLAKVDYAGNAGTRPEGENGVVMRTTRGTVRPADVTDGLSNTVLLGERRLNRARLGQTEDDDESYATPGWNGDFEVSRTAVDRPGPDQTRPGAAAISTMFGSSHPGVFDAAFGDGSVRPIRYTIDPETWRRACVRNDSGPPPEIDP